MTLVGDRFMRFDDGTVRDLATGERITLIEITLTDAAEQVARREYCLARLDAEARGGRATARGDSAEALEGFALVDFALIGESRWIEAYRTTAEAATSREWEERHVVAGPVVDAIASTLDALGSRDVRRLYVKAPDDARLDTFHAIVAREVRARGFIPLSASVVSTWPAIAPLLAARSIVLLGDERCAFSSVSSFGSLGGFRSFNGFSSLSVSSASGFSGSIARAVALVHRAASVVAAIVARICDHVNVAALHLMPVASFPRATVALRSTPVPGIVSEPESDLPPHAESAWPPQSVVQPAVAISYDDPDLPSLFPRTDQIAQVAETAMLAPLALDEPGSEPPVLSHVGWSSVINAANGEAQADTGAHDIAGESDDGTDVDEPSAAPLTPANEADADRARELGLDAASRYPPLRLVERRSRPEPTERVAVAIPVVTTMVSGYGEAMDVLVGRGRWAAASRALRADLAALERRKHRHDAARTSIALGRLHLAIGEVGPAARWFDRAGELASAAGADSDFGSCETDHSAARLIGEALRWSGMAALDDADLEKSERLLRCALAAIGPEADPHQALAIELSLARCLFWQGRGRDVVLPSLDALAAPSEATSSNHPDALATVILRVERWRRAARLAIADGDLSAAGDAIARACRIARGDDEEDVRSAGCRIDESAGGRAGTRKERSSLLRVREALRAACHLDAARLQVAIGDTGSGDVHLRECLKLSRAPARTVRAQLLQLARLRSVHTSEGRRRFERLSAALREPRMPRLVRIQAKYLIDPPSRRQRSGGGPRELVTFLDRHGDTALAGYGHVDRRGGSPMLEAFQDVLRICHETPDDLAALARVSAYLRDQLRALSVAIYGAAPAIEADQNHDRSSAGGRVVMRYAVAGSTRALSPELAARAIDSGLLIPPTYRADALDAAAPVRYGGGPIGAIVMRWSIDAALDHTNASALISAAAATVSPHLRAALDRERPDGDTTAADSRSRARTLGLLGISSAIDTLRQTITRVASAPFHVLIEGESGSGKELVARALHQHGPRRHRRFCAVNCAALTDELLEAELFGHTRGAFTGALTERAGLFEEADGGTLFLDEIGELSPRGQAKLLRVIQDGETRRIGENLPRRVDTRIVAATNRSLRDEAAAGRFRADLVYRLDVIRIAVPPLRARPEDVPVLARAFWDEAIARLGSRATLDPATLTALARYHWPGNVRELHNAIMALAVHAPPRGRVTPSLLPAAIGARAASGAMNDAADRGANDKANDVADAGARANARRARAGSASDDSKDGGGDDANGDAPSDGTRDDAKAGQSERESLPFEGPLEDAKRAFESRYIRAALARAGGSPSRAARSLGLTRQGLKKLMARLDMNDEWRPSPGRRGRTGHRA